MSIFDAGQEAALLWPVLKPSGFGCSNGPGFVEVHNPCGESGGNDFTGMY
jgi:hypothetical protein